MKTNGFVRSLSRNSLISPLTMRKVLTVMLCAVIFAAVFVGAVRTNVSASPADGECVIIVQGHEDSEESFATNTVNALETAFKSLSGVTVKAIKEYTNKQGLLDKLEEEACKVECKDVALIFIGHVYKYDIKDEKGNIIEVKHGLKIGSGETENDGLFGNEIAKIINERKKKVKLYKVKLYADLCRAETFLDEIKDNLADKTPIQVALGSCKKNQDALFFPLTGLNQHYVFSQYFLEDYYLIITDPNVMKDIKEKAAKEKDLSITTVIMHEAFKSAKTKTQQQSGGKRVPVETDPPTIDGSKIKLPNKPLTKITLYEDGQMEKPWYVFNFYKVIDLSTKKCVVVGWVSNRYGLPIAPIESKSSFCNIDCSLTKFKFKVGNEQHTVKIEKEEQTYTVTGDKQSKKPWFKCTRLNLMKGGNKVGDIRIWVKPGQIPDVIVTLQKVGKDKILLEHPRAKVTNKKYDSETGTLTFEVEIEKEKHKITIKFKPFGEHGYFILALTGDLDGNGEVNIIDIALVCKAFGSKPGDPNWNPKTDMDGNGVVNIVDVAKVAFHFVAFHVNSYFAAQRAALPPDITPPPAEDVLRAAFTADAKSIRDESGCRSTVTISYEGQDLTGGNNPVTNVILKVNGVEWHDSGTISTVHYQNSVSRQVGCGKTFNIEVTASNKNGQRVTVPGSITTSIP